MGPLRRVCRGSLAAIALLLASPAHGQIDFGRSGASRAPQSAERLVKVRAVSDVPHVAPGQTFHVAVVFDIEPNWHIYWLNAGDSGTPTEVTVEAPKGWKTGATLYPRPHRFKEPDGVAYGYERRTVLYVPVTAPKTLEDDRVTLDVDVFFLVCKDVCLMGSVQKPVVVRTSSGPVGPTPVVDRTLIDFRKRLPKPLADLKGATVRVDGDRLVIDGPAGGMKVVTAFPDWVPGVVLAEASTAKVVEGRFHVEMPLSTEPQNAEGPLVARGLLALGRDDDGPCYHFELPLEAVPDAP
jgi:thiol:disulfide interchange protein DsbD